MFKFMEKAKARNTKRMNEEIKPLLISGETIQATMFASENGSQNNHAIFVTDLRIIVMKLNFMGRLSEHAMDVARSTKLGPFTGKMWHYSDALPEPLYISYAFKAEVALADSLIG